MVWHIQCVRIPVHIYVLQIELCIENVYLRCILCEFKQENVILNQKPLVIRPLISVLALIVVSSSLSTEAKWIEEKKNNVVCLPIWLNRSRKCIVHENCCSYLCDNFGCQCQFNLNQAQQMLTMMTGKSAFTYCVYLIIIWSIASQLHILKLWVFNAFERVWNGNFYVTTYLFVFFTETCIEYIRNYFLNEYQTITTRTQCCGRACAYTVPYETELISKVMTSAPMPSNGVQAFEYRLTILIST